MSASITSDGLMNLVMSSRKPGSHTFEIQRFARVVCNLLLPGDHAVPVWGVAVKRIMSSTSVWSNSERYAIHQARTALGEVRCADLYDSFVASRIELL